MARGDGFRVTRYIGGNSVEEVAYVETGLPPLPGGMVGQANQLLFGSRTDVPASAGCVYSLGLQKNGISNGLFVPRRSSGNLVTAVALGKNQGFGEQSLLVGSFSSGGNYYIDTPDSDYDYSENPSVWWSQTYRIGQPFKITKIRIPLAQAITTNMNIVPIIYTDDGVDTTTLTTINNTNFNGKRNIILRPQNLTGEHNFWLALEWYGSALCVVNLPITIEYELIDD